MCVKVNKKSLIVFTAALTLCSEMVSHNNMNVFAEESNAASVINFEENDNPKIDIQDVTGLNVSNKTISSANIYWNKVEDADGYNIYSFNNSTNSWNKISSSKETKYTCLNLKSGTKYTFAVKAYKDELESENFTEITFYTNLDMVKIKNVKTTVSEAKLSWNKVKNAGGYILKQYNYKTQKWETKKNITGTDYTFTKLSSATTCKFSITAYQNAGGKISYGKPAVIKTTTKPAKIKSLTVSANSTSGYKLSWSKVSGATGYYVYRYNSNKKKYDLISDTKSNSIIISNRKPAQKDVYLIRAVKKFDGKIYKSDAYKKSVSSLPSKISGLNVNVKKGTAEITWSKSKKSSGYQIYYKTANSSKYKLLKEIKNPNITKYTTKQLAGKNVYIKVRAYVSADNKKYCGKFSNSIYKKVFNNKSYNQIINEYKNSYAITTSNAQGYKISDSKKAQLLSFLI